MRKCADISRLLEAHPHHKPASKSQSDDPYPSPLPGWRRHWRARRSPAGQDSGPEPASAGLYSRLLGPETDLLCLVQEIPRDHTAMVALQHDLETGVVQDARGELRVAVGFAFVSARGREQRDGGRVAVRLLEEVRDEVGFICRRSGASEQDQKTHEHDGKPRLET